MRASTVGVESLEERRMFATFSLVSNVLTCNGTSSDETITVFKNNNGTAIKVAVTGSADQFSSYANSSLVRVDIFANGGNDTVFVENSTNHSVGDAQSSPSSGTKVSVITHLNGGDGNDTITGGEQADVINGDVGDDSLYGYLDNDSLYGGYGADYIFGEAGNDSMDGADTGYGVNDASSDSLDGGSGSDSRYGRGGNDFMFGGSGSDLMFGGAGSDFFDDRDGDVDTLDGGTGVGDSDSAYNDGGTDSLEPIRITPLSGRR